MAAKFDASTSAYVNLTTLGSVDTPPLKISATKPDMGVVALVYWAGSVDATGAAFTLACGGVAMTEVEFPGGAPNFASGDCVMRFYELVGESVPTGPQTIEAHLVTNLGAGVLAVAAASYSGVAAINGAASATGSPGAASLIVPSRAATKFFNAFSCKPSAAGVKVDLLAAPTGLTATTSGAGGTLAAGTYTWTATAINAAGETTGSNQITKTTTGTTSSAALACPAVLGATGWRVYRTKSGVTTLVTTINTGGALTYTDTGAAGTAATVPVANTANVYNQTVRGSTASTAALNPLLIGDADGAGTVEFATTAPVDGTDQWAGIGVGLIGQGAAFDAMGAGASGNGTQWQWLHDVDEDATCMLVPVSVTGLPSGASVTAQVGTTAMVPLGIAGDYAYSTTQTVYSQQEVELILFIFVFIWFYTVATTTTVYSYSPSLFLFGLIDGPTSPLPTGSQTIEVNTSAPASIEANSASYVNVSSFDKVVANGSYASSVTVDSTVPAARVVSAHAIKPQPNTFTYESSANLAGAPMLTQVPASDLVQAKRAVVSTAAAEQILLLGDGPGDFSVTPVALMTSNNNQPTNTPDWCVGAVNLVPSVVKLDVSQTIEMPSGSASLTDYRSHAPSPLRTWVVPATIATPATYGLPVVQWTQAVDSVLDYTLDWTLWIGDTGDSLVDATFSPVGGQLIIVSQTFTNTATSGWITGGAGGIAVPVIVHAKFLSGREDDRTFLLNITQT